MYVCVSLLVCLPGVIAAKLPRKTRGELAKLVDADYYGYRDEDDGVIIPLEQEREKEGQRSRPAYMYMCTCTCMCTVGACLVHVVLVKISRGRRI